MIRSEMLTAKRDQINQDDYKSKMNRLLYFNIFILCCIMCGCTLIDDSNETIEEKKEYKGWPTYQGDPGRNQYSSLNQIDKANVERLQVAWSYHTGDIRDNRSQIQCNPIIIDNILYGTSPKIKLFALDAVTGRLLWEFDPDLDFAPHPNRGVTYWRSGHDIRIFFTAGSLLFAINADTGKPMASFGTEGVTSLKKGLGLRSADLYVASTTPGVIYKDLLIIGTRVSEGADAAPGYIQAFNVRTGNIEWVFHTIPKPGEFGYDTWPEDAYARIGGANAWAGISLDEKRGVIYAPTGSASFDFWGGIVKGLIYLPTASLRLKPKRVNVRGIIRQYITTSGIVICRLRQIW